MTHAHRREVTERRVAAIQGALESRGVTPERLRSVCVYATGSIGRGEASESSDLDVFLLDTATEKSEQLSRLDTITITADLIRAAADAEFPKFSRDGEFLKVHVLHTLLDLVGSEQDDLSNFFTARMLLLLESRCLVNDAAYDAAIRRIVDVYWRDYEAHADDFRPAFLGNDLMRFWKTLCLNYEEGRKERPPKGDPARRAWDLERRPANLKLGFSRLWTCHTGIAYLVAAAREQAVPPEVAVAMATLTPRERMEELAVRHAGVVGDVSALLEHYDWFLDVTNRPAEELTEYLADNMVWAESRRRSEKFGDAMYSTINSLGAGSSLLRYLLV